MTKSAMAKRIEPSNSMICARLRVRISISLSCFHVVFLSLIARIPTQKRRIVQCALSFLSYFLLRPIEDISPISPRFMSALLHRARFFTTVNHLKDLPVLSLPEVAFAGRSNAGKSSAINALCQQKRLAFSSKTPGRTQHINYFAVGLMDQPLGHLVDLPGYGYAKVPWEAKAHWGQLLSRYLPTRVQLRGLILLMDARHPCTELDCQMLAWFAPTKKPIHVLLTKADKLTRQAGIRVLNETREALSQQVAAGALTVQLFSALKRVGLETAQDTIQTWLLAQDTQ
jgi:GTP-binding protein